MDKKRIKELSRQLLAQLVGYVGEPEVVERAIAEAVAEEREACIKIADTRMNDLHVAAKDIRGAAAAYEVAELIRARGAK